MKIRFICLILLFGLILTSCSTVKQSDVSLTLKKSVLPFGTKTITIKWNNNTDSTISFGEEFGIEKKANDEWTRVHYANDYTFNDVSIVLPSKAKSNQTYNLYNFYGKDLSKGEYRIRVNYSFDDGKDHTQKDYYVLYAEFKIE